MDHITVSRNRLVLRRLSRFGVLLVSGALFLAFVVGWLLGNVLQLATVYMPKLKFKKERRHDADLVEHPLFV